MQVDRASFLALTAALFAACGPTAPPVAADSVTVPELPPPPVAPVAPVALDAGVPERPVAPEPPQPQPASAASDTGDEAPYEPGSGATPPLASSLHPQACATAGNAVGAWPGCALSRPPGPTCESYRDTLNECQRFKRWLTPRAAAHAAACLQAKSGKAELCEFNAAMACAAESFGVACLDPTPAIDRECRDVADRCARVPRRYRHMTFDACRAALSAIVPARRRAFVHCAAESCALVQCAYAADQ
ncbi:MAG: hypothetical protein IPF92_25270 [Myxococcales bacterium]|jgi:hypothetical protein|nr:hypothetical protein [Myxococcales bacterium]MBL0195769.1 hypothetical protein [Myxococcales bacterium]HQY60038.1 hypothetical protein [Polyangiaceae bacterium]